MKQTRKYQQRFLQSGISFLLSMLIVSASFCQLQELETSNTTWTTVGEVKWLANTRASLKYFVSRADTTYLLYLQDEEKLKNSRDRTITKHFSIAYSGANNTTGKLYDLLTSFFSPENRRNKKLEKIFTLGNEMVHVQHYPKFTLAASSFVKPNTAGSTTPGTDCMPRRRCCD